MGRPPGQRFKPGADDLTRWQEDWPERPTILPHKCWVFTDRLNRWNVWQPASVRSMTTCSDRVLNARTIMSSLTVVHFSAKRVQKNSVAPKGSVSQKSKLFHHMSCCWRLKQQAANCFFTFVLNPQAKNGIFFNWRCFAKMFVCCAFHFGLQKWALHHFKNIQPPPR